MHNAPAPLRGKVSWLIISKPSVRAAVLLLLLLLQSSTLLPAADAADLLQLAINCSNLTTATAALSCFPSQLEPTAARRLLLTAAVRQLAVFARRVAAAPAVQQHLDAPTLSAVLRALLLGAEAGLCASSMKSSGDSCAIGWLVDGQRAVAQQMEGAALVQVLHAAVRSCADMALFGMPLLHLPNAQQLESLVCWVC
jgi:hypothetical protein